ncbi:hypothetical protein ACFPYI_06890 [Halomarina salina]|uniref:MarR family transcriptional regulator n=1 Tax=Halomarina salina TaxID=1872699 RepID=A0ABD5RL41_9EURY|nr:hypothetical protein [Halomarina salina]
MADEPVRHPIDLSLSTKSVSPNHDTGSMRTDDDDLVTYLEISEGTSVVLSELAAELEIKASSTYKIEARKDGKPTAVEAMSEGTTRFDTSDYDSVSIASYPGRLWASSF